MVPLTAPPGLLDITKIDACCHEPRSEELSAAPGRWHAVGAPNADRYASDGGVWSTDGRLAPRSVGSFQTVGRASASK